MADTPTTVNIPGEFIATYTNGKITGWTFTPHASYAGWFGPAATVESGDGDLDVALVDGPFWTAVQETLAIYSGKMIVTWEE